MRDEKGPLAKLAGTPDDVARAIEKAIEKKKKSPKARYTVSGSAKLLLGQRALLSAQAWDRGPVPAQHLPQPGVIPARPPRAGVGHVPDTVPALCPSRARHIPPDSPQTGPRRGLRRSPTRVRTASRPGPPLAPGDGMTTPNALHPTLPHFGGAAERRALLAGITFLEVTESGRLDVAGLAQWFDDHVVAAGCMPRLSVVLEPPAGTVALRPGTGSLARASADLPRILTTSRVRVVDALRGLISPPSDDRFLRAAIFLGRVRREGGQWVARPEATAPLSGIVLSLFAVAILSERAFYDRHLCVCDTCGRVSFDAAAGTRRTCSLHPPRGSGMSVKASARVAQDQGEQAAPRRISSR